MEDLIQKITDAKQKRMKVVADQKAIYTAAEKEGRNALNADEKLKYDAFEEDFKALDEQVRNLTSLREKEERLAMEQHEETRKADGPDDENDGDEEEVMTEARKKEEMRYGRAFNKYLRYGMQNLDAEEQKLLRQRFDPGKEGKGEVRAQTVTTTGGGYAIPPGFAGRVEQIMKYYGPMVDNGVTGTLTTSRGNNIAYPTLDGTSTKGRLLAINTAVTTTDLTFGTVPLDAYKFSSDAILVPNELLEDEDVDLENVINHQLAERLGRIQNEYFTTGTGSSQPNGVVTASSAGVTAAGSTAFTWAELMALEHSVDKAYRNGPKVGYMMHDNVVLALKQMTLGGGGGDAPLWVPSTREGEPDKIGGYRYFVNNDMASSITNSAKVLLFGDFSKFLVRKVSGIRLFRLTERYADSDQVGFFAFMRADSDLIASGAIKRLTMAA